MKNKKNYTKKIHLEQISFSVKVLDIVSSIPKGEIMSYSSVAMLAGSSRAARSVGSILKKNYNPGIPCHRVIRADGKCGGYNRGTQKKKILLKSEGIACA